MSSLLAGNGRADIVGKQPCRIRFSAFLHGERAPSSRQKGPHFLGSEPETGGSGSRPQNAREPIGRRKDDHDVWTRRRE